MIKKRGSLVIRCDGACLEELLDSADSLPEGKYTFIIFDERKKNPALPHLKYLFGVVLKTISDQHPDHPPVDALYRYFEGLYAPKHTCHFEGRNFEYSDLKNENTNEVNNVIADIIHHATSRWGIQVEDRSVLSLPPAQEAYEDAYIEMWKDTLNTNNIIHTDE